MFRLNRQNHPSHGCNLCWFVTHYRTSCLFGNTQDVRAEPHATHCLGLCDIRASFWVDSVLCFNLSRHLSSLNPSWVESWWKNVSYRVTLAVGASFKPEKVVFTRLSPFILVTASCSGCFTIPPAPWWKNFHLEMSLVDAINYSMFSFSSWVSVTFFLNIP